MFRFNDLGIAVPGIHDRNELGMSPTRDFKPNVPQDRGLCSRELLGWTRRGTYRDPFWKVVGAGAGMRGGECRLLTRRGFKSQISRKKS